MIIAFLLFLGIVICYHLVRIDYEERVLGKPRLRKEVEKAEEIVLLREIRDLLKKN